MAKIICDHFTPKTGRCRCRARVKIVYLKRAGERAINRCWQHYHELEQRARQPDACFTITESEAIQ